MLPAIFGLAGPVLSAAEKRFFAETEPAGYILFARNVEDREQLRALTDSLRDLHGRDDLLVMIDQEGGRVQRMGPPVWSVYPAGAAFDRLYDIAPISAMQAARLNGEAIACDLAEAGITMNALPLLDVRAETAHEVIGDRALGADPVRVAALGRHMLDGLAAGGVVGVVKHMPGHGRALADSHKELPRVDASEEELACDLLPFERLSDAPAGMTAHVVYSAWDDARPATQSPEVISRVIRGRIGFDGLLMSDDIDMEALSGGIADRSVAATAAGCDLVLNCWAKMDDMRAMAERLPPLGEKGRARLAAAMASVDREVDARDAGLLAAERDRLLAEAVA
jgi:beta-N-acetylhexosaminidase